MDAEELAARAGIGERIKSERQRLGLTPEDLAEKTGVSRSTAFNYEAGLRVPDALVLQRMQRDVGVDVMFVLLGQRGQPSTLSCDARQLLDRVSGLPPRLRTVVEEVALTAWLAFDARRTYDYGNAFTVVDNSTVVVAHEPAPKAARKPKRPT